MQSTKNTFEIRRAKFFHNFDIFAFLFSNNLNLNSIKNEFDSIDLVGVDIPFSEMTHPDPAGLRCII